MGLWEAQIRGEGRQKFAAKGQKQGARQQVVLARWSADVYRPLLEKTH